MDSLKDFKNAADEIMKDITVSDELKQKTLMGCKKKRNSLIKTTLVPAACIMILVISAALWKFTLGTMKPISGISNNNEDVNIMTAIEDNNKSQRTTVSTSLKSLDEAKAYIGNVPLIPTYLPEQFKLKGIQAVSYNSDKRRSIWLEYVYGDKTLLISIEQESEWKSFEGYKDVDINSFKGHVKSFKDSSYESAELRWFSGKSLYTVEGAISEQDALKIAKSLK